LPQSPSTINYAEARLLRAYLAARGDRCRPPRRVRAFAPGAGATILSRALCISL